MPYTEKYTFDNREFIAMLAHDMKTPVKAQLRAMMLLSSGIYGKFGEDARNLINNVIASNKYMQCLVDNVLNDYKINNGKFVINKTLNDFRKTIEESLNNIGILSDVKEQKVEISYIGDDFLCLYDEIEIQRVVINLLSNAFEYSREKSGIKIDVKKSLTHLKVKITSENPSVKPKTEHGANKTHDCFKAGSGLGLLICKTIILAHGGEFKKSIARNGEYIIYFMIPLN